VRARRLLFALSLAAVLSCNDGSGPGSGPEDDPGQRLTSVGYLWSPVAWSSDGTEIYVVAGRFAPDGSRDQLLAIDVTSGAMRVLATCAAPETPLAVTSVGVAFLGGCGTSTELRLVGGGRDTLLAADADWVVRSPGANRLIYGALKDAPCDPCYPITAIDIPTLESYAVPKGGLPSFYAPPTTTSPDGAEVLSFHLGVPAQWARLSLATGDWTEIVRDGWESMALVGWNSSGIWMLRGSSGDELVEALGATIEAQLPRDPSVISSQWTSGFTAPDGASIAVWQTGCTNLDDQYTCDGARYSLWSHNLATHANTFIARGSATAFSSTGGDPYWQLFGQGAFSPNGSKIAYIIHGDVYLRATP